MKRLDDYALDDVDLIKIDVEGYEFFVIQGGEATITRNRPVMIVEQKPQHGGKYGLTDTQAVDHLVKMGATVKEEIVGDFILVWPDAS